MNPIPLRIRVLSALELSPMTLDTLARCLSVSRFSIERQIADFRRLGVVAATRQHTGRTGPPQNLYQIAV